MYHICIIFVYTWLCSHIHTHMHTHMHTHPHTHTHRHTHTGVYIYDDSNVVNGFWVIIGKAHHSKYTKSNYFHIRIFIDLLLLLWI